MFQFQTKKYLAYICSRPVTHYFFYGWTSVTILIKLSKLPVMYAEKK